MIQKDQFAAMARARAKVLEADLEQRLSDVQLFRAALDEQAREIERLSREAAEARTKAAAAGAAAGAAFTGAAFTGARIHRDEEGDAGNE